MFMGDLLEKPNQVGDREGLRTLFIFLVNAESTRDAEAHRITVAAKESTSDASRGRLDEEHQKSCRLGIKETKRDLRCSRSSRTSSAS